MKVVVTGAGGQLGSELCRQSGADFVGVDLPEFDLTDREGVLRTLTEIGPKVVINTAAYTQVDKAEEELELCRAVNAGGVAHLVEACRELDAVLVQVSTNYVFGRDWGRRTAYRETDQPSPVGVYAHTKYEGERHTAQWDKHFIVRTSGLYGEPGLRSGGHFVDSMLRQARRRHCVRVVDDQHFTPSYAVDVARAIRFLLGTEAFGAYHVVNSGETTWYGFASEIFRFLRQEVELEAISTAEYGARAPRPPYSVLDTSRYEALPGRPAMRSWQEALAEYLRLCPSPGDSTEPESS